MLPLALGHFVVAQTGCCQLSRLFSCHWAVVVVPRTNLRLFDSQFLLFLLSPRRSALPAGWFQSLCLALELL
jgi:hypothetical protein